LLVTLGPLHLAVAERRSTVAGGFDYRLARFDGQANEHAGRVGPTTGRTPWSRLQGGSSSTTIKRIDFAHAANQMLYMLCAAQAA